MRGAVLTRKTMHAARNVSLLQPKTKDVHNDSITYRLVLFLVHSIPLHRIMIVTVEMSDIYIERQIQRERERERDKKTILKYIIFPFSRRELIKNLLSNWAVVKAFSVAHNEQYIYIYNIARQKSASRVYDFPLKTLIIIVVRWRKVLSYVRTAHYSTAHYARLYILYYMPFSVHPFAADQ